MRRMAALVLLAALTTGCLASGGQNDPFAYTRKPLYAGGFDLERLDGATEAQAFRVTDGSIGRIRALVWVNATEGGATVTLADPSGRTVLTTTEATERSYPLALGEWTVTVQGQPASAGRVHILVVRG